VKAEKEAPISYTHDEIVDLMIEYIKTHPSAEKIYRPDKKYIGE
jgi:hypothetical protein